MTIMEMDEVLDFLTGVLLRAPITVNQREAWWKVLQHYDFQTTYQKAQDFLESEQARYGFPKPYDIAGERTSDAVDEKRIGIKCDKCKEALTIVHRRVKVDGKSVIVADKSEVDRHYLAHAQQAMEAKHGDDASKWPDFMGSMREMLRKANEKADAEARAKAGIG